MCGQIDVGTLAIVGPHYPSKLPVVQSTCTTLNVPHLSTAPPSNRAGSAHRGYTLYLYPPDSALSQAHRDIIASRGWKSFTIIYEDPRCMCFIEFTWYTKVRICNLNYSTFFSNKLSELAVIQ